MGNPKVSFKVVLICFVLALVALIWLIYANGCATKPKPKFNYSNDYLMNLAMVGTTRGIHGVRVSDFVFHDNARLEFTFRIFEDEVHTLAMGCMGQYGAPEEIKFTNDQVFYWWLYKGLKITLVRPLIYLPRVFTFSWEMSYRHCETKLIIERAIQ